MRALEMIHIGRIAAMAGGRQSSPSALPVSARITALAVFMHIERVPLYAAKEDCANEQPALSGVRQQFALSKPFL